jgi:hypothetical protein
MRVNSIAIVVVCALTALAGQVLQKPAASLGIQTGRVG